MRTSPARDILQASSSAAPALTPNKDIADRLSKSKSEETLEEAQTRRRRRRKVLQEMKRRRRNQVSSLGARASETSDGVSADTVVSPETSDSDFSDEGHWAMQHTLQLDNPPQEAQRAPLAPSHRASQSLQSAFLNCDSHRWEKCRTQGSTSMKGSLSQDARAIRMPRSSESSDTQSFYDAADMTDESPDLAQTERFCGTSSGSLHDENVDDNPESSVESWLHLRSRAPLGTASSATLRQDHLRASISVHGDGESSSLSPSSVSPAPLDESGLLTSIEAAAFESSFLPSPPSPSTAAFQQFTTFSTSWRRSSFRLPPPRPLPEGPLPPTPPKGTEPLSPSSFLTSGSTFISEASDGSSAANATASEASASRHAESAAFEKPPAKPVNTATSLPMFSPQQTHTAAASAVSSCEVRASLSASATMRGRPRGATIGAIPSMNTRVSSMLSRPSQHQTRTPRPRSLLSHELVLSSSDDAAAASSPRLGTPASISLALADHPSGVAASSSLGGGSNNSRRTSTSTNTGLDSSMTSYSAPIGPSDGEKRSASVTAESGSIAFSTSPLTEERRASGSNTRSRSGSTASVLLQQVQHPKSHANFVIAVVGHLCAGKSTVINKGLRQFGLSRPQVLSEKVTSHSTVCIVDHEQRIIEVLEIDTSVLLSGPSKRFCWPKFLPPIDAVILCYDASNLSSFRSMSELLENFAISNLSTVMLACKSENVPKAVDPYYASEMAGVYNVGLAECTVQSEEGRKRMRDCFSYLVKEVAKARSARSKTREQPTNVTDASSLGLRPEATASAVSRGHLSQLHAGTMGGRSRSNSAVSGGSGSSASSAGALWPRNRTEASAPGSFSDYSASQPFGGSVEGPSRLSSGLSGGQSVGNADLRNVSGSMSRSEPSSVAGESSLDDEGADAAQESITRAQLGLQSAKSAGGYVTLEKLWDKLFFAAVTGSEERFLLMFMVFYRGFVRPIELLRQMISRFESLASREQKDSLIRYSLLRLTAMLGDWMQDYPGDLSGIETWPLLCNFFDRLCAHPTTTHLALPLRPLLRSIQDAPDLDAAWSKDQDSSKPKSVAADVPPVRPPLTSQTPSQLPPEMSRMDNSSRDLAHSEASSGTAQSTQSEREDCRSTGLGVEVCATRDRSASDVTASSSLGTGDMSSSSTDVAPPTASSAVITQSGASIGPAPLNNWSPGGQPKSPKDVHEQKFRLRAASTALAEIEDAVIAAELTRLEWDLFIAIRPRDLLRHILSNRESRPKESPVARSIAFFNYVSYWVASMIVVQSKTKLRARMLEKFMNIAAILRHSNNYNTLQALLAGLGNSAVHRLKTAHSLIMGKPVNKAYQSLLRLMGSDRSFAAYRLALENSDGRTIPYLGVHLQDILSMSDGNPSKRATDEMVHWRKFSLMDEAVMALVHCQQWSNDLPPPNKEVERHIMGLPLFDEETLYSRSLAVEPRGSHGATSLPGTRILQKYLNSGSNAAV